MVKICKSDITIEADHTTIMAQPSMLAKKWARTKFAHFFPSSPRLAVNPQEAQHMPNTAHMGKPEALQTTTLKAVPEEMYGMNKTELHQTPKLCGLQQGYHKLLPEWFKIIAEKSQNDNTRNQPIVQALQKTFYKDAEISITSQLLTTTHKQKWLSDQPIATDSTTCKGFPPFAVPELSEETINEMNEQAKALAAAKTTMAKEILEGLFQKPIINNENSEFLQGLQHYANL
eukprot:805194-Ditylum_brightwellii.AAC.1